MSGNLPATTHFPACCWAAACWSSAGIPSCLTVFTKSLADLKLSLKDACMCLTPPPQHQPARSCRWSKQWNAHMLSSLRQTQRTQPKPAMMLRWTWLQLSGKQSQHWCLACLLPSSKDGAWFLESRGSIPHPQPFMFHLLQGCSWSWPDSGCSLHAHSSNQVWTCSLVSPDKPTHCCPS